MPQHGYTVEMSSTGTTIRDKKQISIINDSSIRVADGNYDFTKDSGFVDLPQNGTASKQKTKNQHLFINSHLILSLKEKARLKHVALYKL